MNFSNEFIQKIINDVFPGITFYYRDANIDRTIIDQYYERQILKNDLFLDMSHMGGKLQTNTRYLIASNKATNLAPINPDVAKWGMNVINRNTYFQVINIIKEGDKTQLLLLHIPEEGVELFHSAKFNLTDQIIDMGKESFEAKKSIPSFPALQEEDWLERTKYPIGFDHSNNLIRIKLPELPKA